MIYNSIKIDIVKYIITNKINNSKQTKHYSIVILLSDSGFFFFNDYLLLQIDFIVYIIMSTSRRGARFSTWYFRFVYRERLY